MNFSREGLQSFDPVEYNNNKQDSFIRRHIDTVIDEICKMLEYSMTVSSVDDYRKQKQQQILTEKRFQWNGLVHVSNVPMDNTYFYADDNILIERLIMGLKKRFVGCTISVDPYKTNIMIDWS